MAQGIMKHDLQIAITVVDTHLRVKTIETLVRHLEIVCPKTTKQREVGKEWLVVAQMNSSLKSMRAWHAAR